MDGKPDQRQKAIENAMAELEKGIKELKENYERDLSVLTKALKKLKAAAEPEPVPGEWEGMCLTDGIHAYLSLVHEGAVRFKDLMLALESGGVRMGDPEKPKRFAANVKTTIINNRDRFQYNKRNDTVRLLRPRAVSRAAATA